MVRLSDLSEFEAEHLLALDCPQFSDSPFAEGPDLKDARVALITSAGLSRRDDSTFRPGATDYRVIPGDIASGELVMSHVSTNYDRTGFAQDLNVVFPIDRLREMETDGTIGSAAGFHYSFMGATEPEALEESARQLAGLLKEDKVNAVFLTPVWPNCTRAVGGLARYIEDEGIATVLISLVREHTEQMNPPRALWVPFDLGRPMGAPDEPDFQRRVLESGLSLLAEKSGPVLADFPDDAPGSKPEDMSGWVCPVNLAPADADEAESCLRAQLEQEMTALQPWYDLQLEQKGRTTVGVGADNIRDSAKLIAGFLEDPSIDSPCDYRPLALMLKYNAEDLKAWYFEAATAQPGGSGRELADWFWKATTAGKSLLQLASTMRACDNKGLQALGTKGIVPRAYEHLVP